MADILDDLRERYEYGKREWQPIRKEAATDMAYVAGDPWDADDKIQRAGRPTIAPEEMGQYFNQVINQLWANPRGMKFAPRGNGASEAGARFYQNKAREIEYRSHAKVGYITAASDAIQRSYGFVGIAARYASPRSANQELWIEAKPDPDMITIDPEALSPDSSDMTWAFEEEWREHGEFKRKYGQAKLVNFGEWSTRLPSWVAGNKVKVAKYWAITTKPRTLVLVQMPAAVPGIQPVRNIAPPPQAAPEQREVFDDEIPPGAVVLRELRKVDYPTVRWHLTNGIEILDRGDWPGKYIPIVSCYGKVLYVPTGGETKRTLLSMTRFGRAPWKAMCYADSSICEVTSGLVKAPFMVPKGTFAGPLATAVQESMYQPKAFLEFDDDPKQRGQPNGPPQRPDTPNAQYLQSLLLVSERFRRGIQSAMATNFLPSQAQRRNEKSGVALEEIKQAATTGTFHFVNNYEDMIRMVGVVVEDLIDKYHDYAGETAVMDAEGKAQMVAINSDKPDAISTKGDYLVTVSTGPSSDSEHEAVQDFADSLAQNIERIAQITGPKPAAAVFARAIRLRNGGPQMDALADLIEPPEFKQKDGEKPPDPHILALKAENQQLKGVLQQAEQEKQAKLVEIQGKGQIEQLKQQAETQRATMDLQFQKLKLDVESEVKLSVAALGAKIDRIALLAEQQARLSEHIHDSRENAKDRVHERQMASVQHEHSMEQGDQGVAGQIAVQASKPQKPNGSGASA